MDPSYKVLVTGAGGLVGAHLVKRLSRAGCSVTGLYRTIPRNNVDWPVITGDLLSPGFDEATLLGFRAIVHCAAMIPASFAGDNSAVYAANKKMDSRLLRLADETGADMYFMSSTSLYGFDGTLKDETSELSITNDYSKAKYETEQAVQQSRCAKKMIFRINAPYAFDQRHQTVLKTFMERAFTGQDIFYHGEGLRQQDFTHADDIADAVRLSFSERAVNGIYNISGGRPVTMKELGTLAVKCFPGTASKVLPSGKPDEQEGYKALFSIEKAKQLLHWQPRVTLESGLTEWAGHLRRGR